MKTKQYLKRSIKLLFGLVLYAVGIVFIIQANIGLAPWDAFHIGLTYISNFSFGLISILVGLVILVFTFFLDEPIGIGTIANTVLIGLLIDLINFFELIPLFDSTWSGVLIMLLGMELIAVGTYFYIGSAFGVGPRDALMVALTRKTNFPVGLIRATIEISVLVMGWLLDAPIGIGTAIVAFGMGPLVQITFQILNFDVNKITHDAFLVKKKKIEEII